MDLNEVYNDISDISDPSSMEKILMYVDYLQSKDQDFIEELIKKFSYMEVMWEQPWYQKFKSLTRPVPVDDKAELKFRTDKISEKESIRIHKNWKKFSKRFNIPDTPECFARWKNTNKSRNPQTREECVRRFVTAFLAKGLERTLCQVYKHVVRHYGGPNKGHYSLQEEQVMKVCFYHNPRNAVPILSLVLGREPRGIYKKLEEQLNGPFKKKTRIRWKLPLASKFLKLLIEYTGFSVEELKYKKIDKDIWLKLEKDMNQQYIYLQKFWCTTLYVQLYVKKDIKINNLRRKIARKLQQSSYMMWSDIRWKELLKEFPDGFTHLFLYRAWITIFRNHKDLLKLSIQELVQYALQKIPLLSNRRLRTLALNEEGELEEIRYLKQN